MELTAPGLPETEFLERMGAWQEQRGTQPTLPAVHASDHLHRRPQPSLRIGLRRR